MRKIIFTVILLSGVVAISSSYAQESLRQMRSSKIEKINGKEFYIHTVKKGQTLYMISKAYEVDINEVILENPEVKDGIKAGQKIRIPAPVTAEYHKNQSNKIPQELQQISNSETADLLPCGEDKSSLKPTYNIALMIPLYLSEVTQMDVNPDPDATAQENRPLQFVQFYEGFRMALDSLKETGISLKVTVYDVERDSVKTLKLLLDPEFRKTDLIIGMIYHRNFQLVADFAEKNNISIVNPLSERDQILVKHRKVFKVLPSLKSQFSELIGYLQSGYKDSTIIVVSDNQRMNKTVADDLMSKMEEINADVHMADGYGEVLSLLSKNKGNIIVLISDNKSYVLDVVTKLNEHRNDFRVKLLGLPRWDRFDDIEADYLVNLKTQVMAPYFIDYEDTGVRKFVSMYQDRYQTDPEPMAFQGFDITFYFVTALWKYGRSFDRCIPDLRMKSLQTDFRFSSSEENGFENQHWEMYEYDNYRLRRIILQ